MLGKSFGDAIAFFMTSAIICFCALVVIGLWAGIDFFFIEDTYESSKPIIPEVIIKTENVNGIVTSDTTYVYHLK
jgi:hypothetical protein